MAGNHVTRIIIITVTTAGLFKSIQGESLHQVARSIIIDEMAKIHKQPESKYQKLNIT